MSYNLPQWRGAEVCYSRAYRVLENMARNGHVRRAFFHGWHCVVSIEMETLIKALDSDGEEQIKGLLLQTHVYH